MNCGILLEAKNDNSKSTYLTDPDVEVYIPVSEDWITTSVMCNSELLIHIACMICRQEPFIGFER